MSSFRQKTCVLVTYYMGGQTKQNRSIATRNRKKFFSVWPHFFIGYFCFIRIESFDFIISFQKKLSINLNEKKLKDFVINTSPLDWLLFFVTIHLMMMRCYGIYL